MWSRHIMAARYCHHALKCDVAVMVVQGQCGGTLFLSYLGDCVDKVAAGGNPLDKDTVAGAAYVVGVELYGGCASFVDLHIGAPIYGAARVGAVGGVACGVGILWRVELGRLMVAKLIEIFYAVWLVGLDVGPVFCGYYQCPTEKFVPVNDCGTRLQEIDALDKLEWAYCLHFAQNAET